ncbi:unnamed protein product [Lampetra fluviatilis]
MGWSASLSTSSGGDGTARLSHRDFFMSAPAQLERFPFKPMFSDRNGLGRRGREFNRNAPDLVFRSQSVEYTALRVPVGDGTIAVATRTRRYGDPRVYASPAVSLPVVSPQRTDIRPRGPPFQSGASQPPDGAASTAAVASEEEEVVAGRDGEGFVRNFATHTRREQQQQRLAQLLPID